MRRECGHHHGHVLSFNVWPTSYKKYKGVNQFHSVHTNSCTAKASVEHANHSKHIGLCGRPRSHGHHKHHHACKARSKFKGVHHKHHKLKSFGMVINHRLPRRCLVVDRGYMLFEELVSPLAGIRNPTPTMPFMLHDQSAGIRISPWDTPEITNDNCQGNSTAVEGKGKGKEVNEDGDPTMVEEVSNDSLEDIDIRKINLQDGEGTSKAP